MNPAHPAAPPPIAPTEAWTVHTEVFEGPLDLLLHLVQKQGFNARELPMARITDSYLEYLDRMTALHLGLAADYLVMASTLIWLKSLELLPRKPAIVQASEEDPVEALASRLEAYQALKLHAEALDELPMLGRDQFAREPAPGGEGPLVAGVSAFGLLDLYYHMLEAREAPPPTHTIADTQATLESACRTVIASLDRAGGRSELGEILRELRTPRERVLAFLGVLEMTRLRWLDLHQAIHLGPVELHLTLSGRPDYALLTGAVEEEIA